MSNKTNNSDVYFKSMVPEYAVQGATSIPVVRQLKNKEILSRNYEKISTVDDFNANIKEIVFGELFFDIRFEHLTNIDDNLTLIKQLILDYLNKNFINDIKIVFIYQPIYRDDRYGIIIDSKLYFDHNNNKYLNKTSVLLHENYSFKVGTNTALYFRYTGWLFENSHKFSVLKLVNIESAFIFADVIPNCILLLHNDTLYFLNREKIFYSMDAFIFESYINTDKSLLHTMRFTQSEIEIIKMILY